jgi:hypothetical protein
MDNLSYQYLDYSFNPDKAAQYTLLLQGGSSRFSFAVAADNKLLLLSNHLSWDIFEAPNHNNPLFANYSKRIIGLPHSNFTFVPVSLFNPEKVADFARFLDVKPDEKVFSQALDTANQVLFKICGEMLNRISDKFDLNDITFAPKGWILATAGNSPSNNDLYLNITEGAVEILHFNDGNLRFYNSFEFKTGDELAYFVTMIAGELQLSPESVNIVVSGEIEAGDANYTRLQYFFVSVGLNTARTLVLPGELSAYTCLSLTALSLCGSSAEN